MLQQIVNVRMLPYILDLLDQLVEYRAERKRWSQKAEEPQMMIKLDRGIRELLDVDIMIITMRMNYQIHMFNDENWKGIRDNMDEV